MNKIICGKCKSEGSPQDLRGWEKLIIPINLLQEGLGDKDFMWLCPNCIMNFQACKDKLSHKYMKAAYIASKIKVIKKFTEFYEGAIFEWDGKIYKIQYSGIADTHLTLTYDDYKIGLEAGIFEPVNTLFSKSIQEVSDEFVNGFGGIIDNEQLTSEIIDWWYSILNRDRKYFKNLYRRDILNKVKSAITSTHLLGVNDRDLIIKRLNDILELKTN